MKASSCIVVVIVYIHIGGVLPCALLLVHVGVGLALGSVPRSGSPLVTVSIEVEISASLFTAHQGIELMENVDGSQGLS